MKYLLYASSLMSPLEQQQLADTAVPLSAEECEVFMDTADLVPADTDALADFHPPALPAEWNPYEQTRGWVCHYRDVHLVIMEHSGQYFAWVREDHLLGLQAHHKKEHAA